MYGTVKCLPVSRRKSISDSSPEPVEVVDQDGAARARREVEEPLELAADARDVRLERVAVEQVALGRTARRVADHPGPAADERDGPPAVALQPQQPEDRHQVADVERMPPTDRTRCSRLIGRPVARRAGSPGVVACRIPRHSSSSRRPRAPRPRSAPVTAAEPSRLDPPEGPLVDRSFTPPMLSCGHRCRPASRGGSATDARPRTAGPRGVADRSSVGSRSPSLHLPPQHHPAGRGRARRSPSARTTTTPPACPTRRRPSRTSSSSSRRVLVRPDRQDRARHASAQLRREVVTYDQIPGEMLDATTSIEDKDFWINAGFDPVGIISRRARHVSAAGRVAPRRSPSSSSAPGCSPTAALRGLHLRAQDPRDHPVGPPDRGVSGRCGQAARSSPPTSTRTSTATRRYGIKAAARGYFGKSLTDLTLAQYAILAAIPQSPTKFDLVRNADEVCTDRRRKTRDDCPDVPARRAARHARSCSGGTTSSTS